MYAQFSYTSFQAMDVTIPQGNNNIFVQDPQFRNQNTLFHPGTHSNVFGTTADPSIGLSWFLNGAFATAVQSLAPCPGMSANGGPLPPQFAPIGLANGQTMRINLYTSRNAGVNCRANIYFTDAAGNAIGAILPGGYVLGSGGSVYLELPGNQVAQPGHRVQIQPHFVATDYEACQAGLEVYASATGVNAAVNQPIQPYYQYEFDPQSLSAGQTLRVNVSASASQSCGAAVSFMDASGNAIGPTLTTTLQPGTASYLDLPSTAVGLTGWSGGHVSVRPVLLPNSSTHSGGDPSLGTVMNGVLISETCFATAEVFDTLTGNTRTLANPHVIN
jgi:hypothetical protein